MSEQLSLFAQTAHGPVPAVVEAPADEQTLEDRFALFLLDCPDVYPEFVKIALDLKESGIERYSSDAVCHVIRYFRATRSRNDGFKINNNMTSRLARKAMAEYPELAGFFETRTLKTE